MRILLGWRDGGGNSKRTRNSQGKTPRGHGENAPKRSRPVPPGGGGGGGAEADDKLWFIRKALILIGCVAGIYRRLQDDPRAQQVPCNRGIIAATALSVIVLAITRAMSITWLGLIEDPSNRFPLQV